MRRKLRVLTLNTWLLRLPFRVSLAPEIDERAALVPGLVAATGADIVLCQEVWDSQLRNQLRAAFSKHGYPYEASQIPELSFTLPGQSPGALTGLLPLCLASLFPGGTNLGVVSALSGSALAMVAASSLLIDRMKKTMGNGLQIFSRYPLGPRFDAFAFSTSTRPDEAFVAKGALRASVQVPSLGWIDVYNSHLGAVDFDSRKGNYDLSQGARRGQQAAELAQWIQKTRTSESALLGVDLNAAPREVGATRATYEHGLFAPGGELDFEDTFEVVGARGAPGHTDDSRNPYKKSGHFSNSPDARIDYIFASQSSRLVPTESQVIFDQPLCGAGKGPARLSDHYGVLTEFAIV